MQRIKRINFPSFASELSDVKAGDRVNISGVIYTARDQAHKRLTQAIQSLKILPVELKGAALYYCGPTKAPKGKIIGSCGPTTSSRMDEYAPLLLDRGLLAMIGKGRRSPEVIDAIKKNKAVYFVTYAGCGALLSKYVLKANVVAYKDLGPEAVLRLEVKDFPVIVAVDSKGKSIY